jgi:uncharacterized protein (DUF885 family)
MNIRRVCALSLLLFVTAAAAADGSPSQQVNELAERFAKLRVDYDPTLAYLTGLTAPDHSRFMDRRPSAIRALERSEDAIAAELAKVPAGPLDAQATVTRAVLVEMLESSRQLRVCRVELWDLSHFVGWQVGFALLAELQPLGSDDLRAQALKRWGSVPSFLDVQTRNLRAGLRAGYSVPKSIVQRVIQQLDAFAGPGADSPLLVMLERNQDGKFSVEFRELVAKRINPAVRRFRAFLVTEYLPKARETLGISALPKGQECYQAYLRSYTTLNRTPAEVMALGEKTVAANEREVIELGRKLYGTDRLADIIARNNDAEGNRFDSPETVIDSARTLLTIAIERSRPFFLKLPDQQVSIEAPPSYQAGTGISAHYEPQPDPTKPARYVEPIEEFRSTTRGLAEVTLVHETVPGHHLQIALAREIPQSSLAKLADNSAYLEGWARYAERLSEEAGIYQTRFALITRRIWPARGMVVDPGIHVFGWSREKAVAYLVSTGRFDQRNAEATVDRIAALPGQLTAYDSGGLEIFALRSEAEAALGGRFDIKEFHQRVLEQGVVPLTALRDHVHQWIAAEKARAR